MVTYGTYVPKPLAEGSISDFRVKSFVGTFFWVLKWLALFVFLRMSIEGDMINIVRLAIATLEWIFEPRKWYTKNESTTFCDIAAFHELLDSSMYRCSAEEHLLD
jgi:hypothetical protein